MTAVPTYPMAHPKPPIPPNSPFASPEHLKIIAELEQLGAGTKRVGGFFVVETSADRTPKPDWKHRWQWEMPNIHVCILDMLQRVYLVSELISFVDLEPLSILIISRG